ncbi:hypothetical protein BpHYR1_038913 [Brachionus plicatilis]|uniref:Uncharacterized protein n=1 Tax=Brachionus plicatilis TaxID=10195 RepID=A0A3M7S0E5_BRAPC|nr:hypothetical protein BpHYR1_038913 [Brachionus plicatilis]
MEIDNVQRMPSEKYNEDCNIKLTKQELILLEFGANLVASMPKRISECLKIKGSLTQFSQQKMILVLSSNTLVLVVLLNEKKSFVSLYLVLNHIIFLVELIDEWI